MADTHRKALPASDFNLIYTTGASQATPSVTAAAGHVSWTRGALWGALCTRAVGHYPPFQISSLSTTAAPAGAKGHHGCRHGNLLASLRNNCCTTASRDLCGSRSTGPSASIESLASVEPGTHTHTCTHTRVRQIIGPPLLLLSPDRSTPLSTAQAVHQLYQLRPSTCHARTARNVAAGAHPCTRRRHTPCGHAGSRRDAGAVHAKAPGERGRSREKNQSGGTIMIGGRGMVAASGPLLEQALLPFYYPPVLRPRRTLSCRCTRAVTKTDKSSNVQIV